MPGPGNEILLQNKSRWASKLTVKAQQPGTGFGSNSTKSLSQNPKAIGNGPGGVINPEHLPSLHGPPKEKSTDPNKQALVVHPNHEKDKHHDKDKHHEKDPHHDKGKHEKDKHHHDKDKHHQLEKHHGHNHKGKGVVALHNPHSGTSTALKPYEQVNSKIIGYRDDNNKTFPEMYKAVQELKELILDTSQILSYKKGDLNMIHTKAWYCTLKKDKAGVPKKLILKQLDCLDESVFAMKIHEANIMLGYREHPNLINILSLFKTNATDSFTYKKIFMLFEDCKFGNFQSALIKDIRNIPRIRIYKYLADICKGLSFLHTKDVVHCGIRIKNLLINRKNDGVLGPMKKTELESMRKTRRLLSTFCLERSVNDYFMYWAPELLLDQGITKASDIWALGVVIFILATGGESPFMVNKRDTIFNSITGGMIKWELLNHNLEIKALVKKMLEVDPKKRIDIHHVFEFFKKKMEGVLHRFFKRLTKKISNTTRMDAIITIQYRYRNYLKKKRAVLSVKSKEIKAASTIQATFRMLKEKKKFHLNLILLQFLILFESLIV